MDKKNNTSTCMWREAPFLRDDKVWRFYTTDPDVNKRMRQRLDFKLVVYGMNKRLWVYATLKNSAKDAKKTLKRITRRNIQFDALNDEYYADPGAIVAPIKKSKV